MREKHAREIRKGLIAARDETRGRREDNLELLLKGMWESSRLRGLSRRAFDRSWRKEWRRFE